MIAPRNRAFSTLSTMVLAALLLSNTAQGQVAVECGSLDNGYGPYDYTNPVHVREYLPRVEEHHFEPEIQRLQEDDDPTPIGGDLDYVLRAFPNHHHALDLMAQLFERSGPQRPRGTSFPIECYFTRAIAFNPRDAVVRMLYGNYLQMRRNYSAAVEQYAYGLEIAPDYTELHYNMGLAFVELRDYEEALRHAKIAYANGFPLVGLRRKLETVDRWTD